MLPNSFTIDGNVIPTRTNFSDGKHAYMPYMEFTVGVENIFRIIRIDYVRRITHLDATDVNGYSHRLKGWRSNGIRITLRAAM